MTLLRPLDPGETASPLRRLAESADQAEAGMEKVTVQANRAAYGIAAIKGHARLMFDQLRQEQSEQA